MGRGFLVCAVLLWTVLPSLSASVSAQEFNQRITVYATVPEQRGIFIDESGYILKVAGNTSNNVTPQVFDLNNHPLGMTPAIQQQYDLFLRSHGNHLEAGQTYTVNPVIVNNDVSGQTIKVDINSENLTLIL